MERIIITFNCQHCGAALLKESAPNLTCTSCKSEILVPESTPVHWQGLSITSDNKRVRRGRHPFPVDAAEHPLLQQYRTEFPLQSIFDDAHDELAALVNLRHRVRTDWFEKRPSAEFLLRYGFARATRHDNYWFCTHFGRMFSMTAAALGLPARVLNVARRVDHIDDNQHGHVVVDIWSNQYQKWVYMDALINFHYEDAAGIPLSLLEARDRYFRHDCADLIVATTRDIKGVTPGKYPLFGDLCPISKDFKERSLNLFWPLYYHGQNYFEIPQGDRCLHLLCYVDDLNRDLQLIGNGKVHFANEEMCTRTEEARDVCPTMNNAEIGLYKTPDGTHLAYLDNQTPNLKQTTYRLNTGSGFGQWTPLKQEAIVLPAITAPVTIEARTENRLGRAGATSCVTLTPQSPAGS